jgi:hypothetical protein
VGHLEHSFHLDGLGGPKSSQRNLLQLIQVFKK